MVCSFQPNPSEPVAQIHLLRLEILGALVGRIPPNPLWAELLWQKQQEMMGAQPA